MVSLTRMGMLDLFIFQYSNVLRAFASEFSSRVALRLQRTS
jgi:hypothetical protein